MCAEMTSKVGVAQKMFARVLVFLYPKHPPTVNPGSAPVHSYGHIIIIEIGNEKLYTHIKHEV